MTNNCGSGTYNCEILSILRWRNFWEKKSVRRGGGKHARQRNKKARDFTHVLTHKSTLGHKVAWVAWSSGREDPYFLPSIQSSAIQQVAAPCPLFLSFKWTALSHLLMTDWPTVTERKGGSKENQWTVGCRRPTTNDRRFFCISFQLLTNSSCL